MEIFINLGAIEALFKKAWEDNRNYLYEYEVYELIRHIGGETPPKYYFFPKNHRLDNHNLESIPGEKIVIKIVSPDILHKSDVGGVSIVDKDSEQILSAVRKMYYEVPSEFARSIEKDRSNAPTAYKKLYGEDLERKIFEDIQGVILCRYVPFDSDAFGNELLVSLRNTREFGMVLNAGLGGTDAELFAESFKKGKAVVAASIHMTGGEEFFDIFKNTLSYKKLAGHTRSGKRLVTDEQLLECFSAFAAIGEHFSARNSSASFIIDELEINPFAFVNFLMMPLDGLCSFSLPVAPTVAKPVKKIDKMLHPESIAIIGVSANLMNPGRVILNNLIAGGFEREKITIIHKTAQVIDGVNAMPDIENLQQSVDLLILAVGARMIPQIMETVVEKDLSRSIILIPGGIGETEGSDNIRLDIVNSIKASREKNGGGPLMLGPNSLGVVSHPGKYDALFIPEAKLPKTRGDHKRPCAFISQSGAYMITRMSKLSFMDPAYAVSIGNQLDLTAGDLVGYFAQKEEIKIIASYMEGFNDIDGLKFVEAVKESVKLGKEVVFYKAGRTPEGKTATSGHTASLAGDYMVCESCLSQAGAMVAGTFTSFEGLIRLAVTLHDKKIEGNRLAAISSAGFETVGIADSILGEDFRLNMARYTPQIKEKITGLLKKVGLDSLVTVNNPLDVTPMADEQTYEDLIRIMLEDDTIDAVVVSLIPLSPSIDTSSDISNNTSIMKTSSIFRKLPELGAAYVKPLVMVVDSGSMYDPLARELEKGGLPVFRSADQAVWVLGKYIHGRLAARRIRGEHCHRT